MSGPLYGIRVVEWGHVHFGPGAGMFLSDMGAEVIRIESIEGDQMRRFETLWGVDFRLPDDRNTFTEDLLRNKQSISLDLAKDEAKEIVYKLVADADVFLTNFRPAAGLKLGLDYESLRAHNPRLIYALGTSYGLAGPEKDAPGLEMMGLARGGMMLGSAVPGGEPVFPTMGLNDRLGSIGLTVAILSALVARERTGTAQFVETSLLGWMVNLQASAVSCAANTGADVRPQPRAEQEDPNYTWYLLKDQTWIALGMVVNPDKYWPLLCQAIEMPELESDARFRTLPLRRTNHHELIKILDEYFATITWPEWDAKIHQYELISSKISALTELKDDEQILQNGYLVQRAHPTLGSFWYVPTPVHYEKTPITFQNAAPRVGENSAEVLRSLGYTDAEIERLAATGVVNIASAPADST